MTSARPKVTPRPDGPVGSLGRRFRVIAANRPDTGQRKPLAAMKHRLFLALSLSAMLAACDSAPSLPGKYPLSAKQAFERLQGKPIPDFIRDRQCGILIHASSESDEYRSVTWQINSSGEEMLSFTATLAPIDAHNTKVDIAVSLAENGREAYDGTQFYRRPAVRQPVRPAIKEQILALLDRRPFDATRMPSPTIITNDSVTRPAPKDTVCLVQRGGLESGRPFSINDPD